MALRLNGKSIPFEGWPLHTTLLDYLRETGLTGSKEGCAEGECGACTVLLVGPSESGSRYVPVNSCLILLALLDGQEVYTVEALAENGVPCEAQQAMIQFGGSQCGYCTPGFVVSMFAEQYRPGRVGACDPHALSGNLCRCTGYRPIRDAALSLGPAPEGKWTRRLLEPAPAAAGVATLAEFFALRQANPRAKVIAGGTDVVVECNLKGKRFPALINVGAIGELRSVEETNAQVEIGAALTLSEIERTWRNAPVVFAEWFQLFASPLIRNRATLGGNLATASPIGDAAPLLLAFDAQLRLVSARGERVVALDTFFTGYRQTVLAEDELIASVILPKPFPEHIRFFKAAKRRLDDISTVAAAIAMNLDQRGRANQVRIAYGGVAAVPLRARAAEARLEGRHWEQGMREAVQELERTLSPLSDHRGSAEYRLAMAENFLAKFWHEMEIPA
ncbi:MAG: FAD binding domain-containing protein [Candidatus Solibacter usitatus]|nr:FAD binding domain-containing protein [Candidatus Solibacter usitatus]